MTRLPYDVSRCTNDACALRLRCLRYLAPGRPSRDPGGQVFSAYSGGEDCDGFLNVEEGE